MNICHHCGHTGDDVQPTYAWVGGQGDTLRPECQDLGNCWRRWHTREEAELEKITKEENPYLLHGAELDRAVQARIAGRK